MPPAQNDASSPSLFHLFSPSIFKFHPLIAPFSTPSYILPIDARVNRLFPRTFSNQFIGIRPETSRTGQTGQGIIPLSQLKSQSELILCPIRTFYQNIRKLHFGSTDRAANIKAYIPLLCRRHCFVLLFLHPIRATRRCQ